MTTYNAVCTNYKPKPTDEEARAAFVPIPPDRLPKDIVPGTCPDCGAELVVMMNADNGVKRVCPKCVKVVG